MSGEDLKLPLNFGERTCDRLLTRKLRPLLSEAEVMWRAFKVWKDFGIARDDRRVVPLYPAARQVSEPVAILEEYCGWDGADGAFVEAAIEAGFFTLVPVDEASADLVLTGFFPANSAAGGNLSNSKLGGINKGVNNARKHAVAATDEQLKLFQATDSGLLKQHSKAEVKDALLLVHQVCRVLHRQSPESKTWESALVVKALDVKKRFPDPEIDAALRWFIDNRKSPDVPGRVDLVLDAFDRFVEAGVRAFPLA